MKSILQNYLTRKGAEVLDNSKVDRDELLKHTESLYEIVSDVFDKEYIEGRLKKDNLGRLLESNELGEKVFALQKLIFNDRIVLEEPSIDEIPGILDSMEEKIADMIARRHVENRIEKKVEKALEEKQDAYMDEMRASILKKHGGPENARTLKKYADLEVLDSVKLSRSIMELVRPSKMNEIIGQDQAVKSLISKISSPYPQHVILYGPPGVGKTSAARLALNIAKELKYTPFTKRSKFVEVDGTTLRWDPREVTNPLLGSVHDPIYQGSKRDLAEDGIPEPKLGLVTEAHGGVLFIDEIGELDEMLQNKLLKVLEDKRVEFSSAYYDPDDENTPKYIKKLFNEGAPADFVLIGATTRQPEEISPAIRSRCAEVFFNPLSQDDIMKIVSEASEKLDIIIDDEVPEIISRYTIEGRKAVNMLADAYGYVLYGRCQGQEEQVHVTKNDIYDIVSMERLVPYSSKKAGSKSEIGKVFGLGVSGYLGSVLEIEAVAFEAEPGKGTMRFNDKAGTMAKDSVFNAAAVLRKITGKDLSDYDIHVNIVGGGNVDGPSAGAAIASVIMSALEQRPLRQDIAITGEVSIRGNIKPVGGIAQKIYGAKQAGMSKVFIPDENMKDVHSDTDGIEIIPVSTMEQVIDRIFCEDTKLASSF